MRVGESAKKTLEEKSKHLKDGTRENQTTEASIRSPKKSD